MVVLIYFIVVPLCVVGVIADVAIRVVKSRRRRKRLDKEATGAGLFIMTKKRVVYK